MPGKKRGRKTMVSPRDQTNGGKMWTKWGLNPRPHATELLSQELAKQARYHCAIRPLDNMALSKDTSVLSRDGRRCRLRKIRASNPTPRLQDGRHHELARLLLTLCRIGVPHYSNHTVYEGPPNCNRANGGFNPVESNFRPFRFEDLDMCLDGSISPCLQGVTDSLIIINQTTYI